MFRFNTHPTEQVYTFLHNILNQEHISLSKQNIYDIINIYESDIRSMINYIQLNNGILTKKIIPVKVICKKLYNYNETYYKKIKYFKKFAELKNKKVVDFIKEIINELLFNLLSKEKVTSEFIDCTLNIYHNINSDDRVLIMYLYENIIPYSIIS